MPYYLYIIGSMINYYNNFEVVLLSYFLTPTIRHWSNAVLRSGGIYRYRWGDAPLRYITLAIFANESQVIHRTDYNISYNHR